MGRVTLMHSMVAVGLGSIQAVNTELTVGATELVLDGVF